MKDGAYRTVVQDHDLAQIRLHLTEIFYVGTIAESAVLTIISRAEILAFTFQPVDDWVGVFLHRGSEDDKIVPFAHLSEIRSQRQSLL